MLYLLLAVLCSSAIGIIFKISEQRNTNRYIVTTINYVTAMVFSGVMLMQSDIVAKGLSFQPLSFLVEGFPTMLSTGHRLSYLHSTTWSVLLGIVTGWFYFISFIYYQVSVRRNGIALSGMFSRMGILVPMALSIVFWQEIPTLIQSIGILLCLISIVLVNLNYSRGKRFEINTTLVLLFFYFGIAIFCNKIFQKYAVLELKPLFLFCLFVSAGITSLSVSLRYAKSIQWPEIVIGVAVGIPNLMTAWFLIQALDTIKASVAFPVFSAGTIISMAVLAVVFFKERITLKNGLAIVATTIALVLINL